MSEKPCVPRLFQSCSQVRFWTLSYTMPLPRSTRVAWALPTRHITSMAMLDDLKVRTVFMVNDRWQMTWVNAAMLAFEAHGKQRMHPPVGGLSSGVGPLRR